MTSLAERYRDIFNPRVDPKQIISPELLEKACEAAKPHDELVVRLMLEEALNSPSLRWFTRYVHMRYERHTGITLSIHQLRWCRELLIDAGILSKLGEEIALNVRA